MNGRASPGQFFACLVACFFAVSDSPGYDGNGLYLSVFMVTSWAINIPVDLLEQKQGKIQIPNEKPLLLYCRTVNKTARAIAVLKAAGFREVYALEGGCEELRGNAIENGIKAPG